MSSAPVISDWSSLPRDLLMNIGELTLKASVEDFMAFGCVCKSWRAVRRDDEFLESIKSYWAGVPFLMLPEKEGQKERPLYSISRGKIFTRLSLPEAKGCRCIESRFGWLLTLACSPENEGDVQLLNPFSRARIPLPNYKTFPSYVVYKNNPRTLNPWFDFITRSLLSANPSHTSDFVVLVAIGTSHLIFWRNGDTHWTRINSKVRVGVFHNIHYSDRDHCFYAVTAWGHICVWDPAGADPTLLNVIYSIDREAYNLSRWGAYLVESSAGELLLVARNGQGVAGNGFRKYRYGATEFRVYQLDVTIGKCKRVWSLKDDAIFVGHNATISIQVQPDDAIKSNHIYFSDDSIYAYGKWAPYPVGHSRPSVSESSDEEGRIFIPDGKRVEYSSTDSEEEEEEEEEYPDGWKVGYIDARCGGGKDMGIYNLADGSIQRFDHPDVETLSFLCPSLWIAPSSFSRWLR